ncbi:hypothetical protein VTI28DRAFT_2969 [Corynascus sepedonium]
MAACATGLLTSSLILIVVEFAGRPFTLPRLSPQVLDENDPSNSGGVEYNGFDDRTTSSSNISRTDRTLRGLTLPHQQAKITHLRPDVLGAITPTSCSSSLPSNCQTMKKSAGGSVPLPNDSEPDGDGLPSPFSPWTPARTRISNRATSPGAARLVNRGTIKLEVKEPRERNGNDNRAENLESCSATLSPDKALSFTGQARRSKSKKRGAGRGHPVAPLGSEYRHRRPGNIRMATEHRGCTQRTSLFGFRNRTFANSARGCGNGMKRGRVRQRNPLIDPPPSFPLPPPPPPPPPPLPPPPPPVQTYYVPGSWVF